MNPANGKTVKMPDGDILAIMAGWQSLELMQGVKPEWFLPLCAQAIEANSLEKQVEALAKVAKAADALLVEVRADGAHSDAVVDLMEALAAVRSAGIEVGD